MREARQFSDKLSIMKQSNFRKIELIIMDRLGSVGVYLCGMSFENGLFLRT